jgi:hypothetical protein
MLANTTHLNKRIATLEKFNSTETSSSMPQLSNDMSPYVPKSARIKLTLQYSAALANDTTLKDLKEKLEEAKKDFMSKTTEILKDCATLEVKKAKELRINAFLSNIHKITDALIFFEQVHNPLVTTLTDLQLSIYTVVAFLRKIQNIIPQPGDPYIYRDYLKMDYPEVKTMLLNNFISREDTEAGNRTWTDNERIFVEKIISKLEATILPVTINLQTFLDKEEKTKKAESQIMARFKKTAILNATEATAVAVNDTSSNNNTNMEQHIKKLVSDAIRAHAASNNNNNNKKRKNSPGDKTPQPSSPKNNKGKSGKNTSQPTPSKKQKVDQDSTANNNGTESILKKKVRFQSPQKGRKHQKGHQEGKKKGVRKGKGKRKNE